MPQFERSARRRRTNDSVDPPGRVIVVGSVNADMVLALPGLPSPGETATASRVAWLPGGKGANQAVAAARFGADTYLVGAVGSDAAGESQLDALRTDNVDVGAVTRFDGADTGVAVVMAAEDGENMIVLDPGANDMLTPETVTRALHRLNLRTNDVCLISHEIAAPTVDAAAAHAFGRGTTIVINPAPARRLSDALISCTPILTPNEHELRQLCDLHEVESSPQGLSGLTRAPVLVSRGRHGAQLASGSQVYELPAPRVQVVDTTGAGDTLSGTLCALLVAKKPLLEAAAAAVRAATDSVTVFGARAGMPERRKQADSGVGERGHTSDSAP